MENYIPQKERIKIARQADQEEAERMVARLNGYDSHVIEEEAFGDISLNVTMKIDSTGYNKLHSAKLKNGGILHLSRIVTPKHESKYKFVTYSIFWGF